MITSLLMLGVAAAPGHHRSEELKAVEAAEAVVRTFSANPARCIPSSLLRDAAGVAVIPHVVRAGLVVGGKFGRGVVLVQERKGCWSNPIFVTLSGKSIGGQIGIESSELVLVFKTRKSLDRALSGKLTLGTDAAIAAGPLEREAEAAANPRLRKAEVFSYSRSKGLFAGLSLEGARMEVDHHANEVFYGVRGGHPAHVMAWHGSPIVAVTTLKEHFVRLSAPPSPPPAPRGAPHYW
jgi:lipid-binding SYLF domain-containing protein